MTDQLRKACPAEAQRRREEMTQPEPQNHYEAHEEIEGEYQAPNPDFSNRI